MLACSLTTLKSTLVLPNCQVASLLQGAAVQKIRRSHLPWKKYEIVGCICLFPRGTAVRIEVRSFKHLNCSCLIGFQSSWDFFFLSLSESSSLVPGHFN